MSLATPTKTYLSKVHRSGWSAEQPFFAWAYGYPGSWHPTEKSARKKISAYCRRIALETGGGEPWPVVKRFDGADWSMA